MERSNRPIAMTLLFVSSFAFGCAARTDAVDEKDSNLIAATAAGAGSTTAVDSNGSTSARISRGALLGGQPVKTIGWAPDPTFPQQYLTFVGRTVTPRVPAKPGVAAIPGAASFTLRWQSSGSPSQVYIMRQTWTLGATDSNEWTAGPLVDVANLGALANGFQFWTDSAPALNTQNCYYVRAGDGTYWSFSNIACAYAPDPDHPHAVGKVQVRLKLSTASTAVTSSNVRVRLSYGIPGGGAAPIYTWLDSHDTPFYTPGAQELFTLRNDDIHDLSDITMIRVEVPGDDGLCLNQIELVVDDTVAYRKSSPYSQGCGDGNPFEWSWHSGLVDGSTEEISFAELRNSSLWKNFSPFIFPGTVNDDHPYGASFVGYTADEFRRKLDGTTGHDLKDDGTDTGSTERRLRNGSDDVTTTTWVDDSTLRVQQHMRLSDSGGCTVDAHPIFNLKIQSYNANGDLFNGSNGPIESTQIVSELLNSGIDQGGWCQFIPGVGEYIQFKAGAEFGADFNAAGATNAGKPPAGMRFCFPHTGLAVPWQGFNDGGLSLCFN
jgi:hypothetical protein